NESVAEHPSRPVHAGLATDREGRALPVESGFRNSPCCLARGNTAVWLPTAITMTDQELEELLRHGEADRVERKQNAADTGDIRQAICAFANDMPDHKQPGVIFVEIGRAHV